MIPVLEQLAYSKNKRAISETSLFPALPKGTRKRFLFQQTTSLYILSSRGMTNVSSALPQEKTGFDGKWVKGGRSGIGRRDGIGGRVSRGERGD